MPTDAPRETLERLRVDVARLAAAFQEEICAALELLEPAARFSSDGWQRVGGGGGRTRVLEDGEVFEKAGVNVSEVFGEVPPRLAARLPAGGAGFSAAGLSVVVHPRSPLVPTAHMNVRFLSRGEAGWFGGGADLTPCYLFEEDCRHFHRVLRATCERHCPDRYAELKRAADAYFFLPHRGEHRGVGGVFFDDLGGPLEDGFGVVAELPRAFLEAYLPIVERRRGLPYGEAERRWQEIRRGRYVEFNLVLDRGTLFGLESGGRTESVLMSLPPRVRWPYDPKVEAGSREAELLEVVRAPREWA